MHTAALGALLLAMIYAAMAQQNGSAYVLTFLIAGVVLVSWLHARANLRGVCVQAGVMPPAQEGAPAQIPLMLTVGTGRVPCGLEITGPGVIEPVFVEHLNVGNPVRVPLPVAMAGRGAHDKIQVVIRSRYPLGFFTSERALLVPRAHVVLPKAEGTLPLPQPSGSLNDEASSSATLTSGEGEDFAGVREWQPGDSLRRVDWKAVARGRPMMVKLWSGAPRPVVWLDWQNINLPDEGRVRQLARWVLDAEAQGMASGLRLPGVEIKPGFGADHQRRCMQALAMTEAGGTQSGGVASSPPVPATTLETMTILPARALKLLLLAISASVLPMWTQVPSSALLVFTACAAIRWFTLRRPGILPLWARLLAVALGSAGTWLQTGTLRGLEPGVAFLMSVIAGKVLEVRAPRDVQVLAMLGWFLCLCDLALDQSAGTSLFAFGVFAIIAAVLVRFRRGSAGMGPPLRVMGALLVQALPLIVLMFVFVPRGSSGFLMRLSQRVIARTGLSASMRPGSVARIAQSSDTVFRVQVLNRPLTDVPPDDRYWRCLVLWQCQGLTWEQGPTVLANVRQSVPARENEVLQKIQLVAHGERWLPALDIPTHARSHEREHDLALATNTLSSIEPVDTLRQYLVSSHYSVRPLTENSQHLKLALQLPPLSPRVRALADSFPKSGQPGAIVQAALSWFRSSGFSYTLAPGEYEGSGQQALDAFLFQRRTGFCEHYAASFATLMRAAGVPARVVVGFVGGESSGDYLRVRQSDAHAWAEVYLAGEGWRRVDPTGALAPERLHTDLLTYFGNGEDDAFGFARNSFMGGAWLRLRNAWDRVNFWWYDRVVQFDQFEQTDLWRSLGLLRLPPLRALGLVLAVFGVPLGLLWLWLRRGSHHPDPGVRAWDAFCRRLSKLGVPARTASEGPAAFAERAAQALPERAEWIHSVGRAYVHYRYGTGCSLHQLRLALSDQQSS